MAVHLSDSKLHRISSIDLYVPENSKGVYALTTTSQESILYVGRSDEDLNDRLKKHIGEMSKSKKKDYTWYKYKITSTKREAYEDECRLFHKHNPPDNSIHPATPEGTNYPCPLKCGK